MKNKNIIISLIVALLVGLVVGYILHRPAPIKYGAIATGSGTPTSFDSISVNGGVRQGVPNTEYPVASALNTVVGNGVATLVTSGSFYKASTTLAVIPNPFGATSTVTISSIQGVNGTSTIDILVGTTSAVTFTSTSTAIINQINNVSNVSLLASSFNNNSQVSPTLIKATTISTSTAFFSTAGAQSGPAAGYANPGANSSAMIVVGPQENIGILATSSYAASSATGNGGLLGATNQFSGTYIIEWQR